MERNPNPTFDLAVVGGGLAGWMAATAARERGGDVAVVEQATRVPGWGNSVVSGGALHAALRDPRTPPAELIDAITHSTGGHADEVVVRTFAHTAERAVEWIEAHGGTLTSSDASHLAKVFAPMRVTKPGMHYAGMGTGNFLKHLRSEHLRNGGTVFQPARAISLAPGTTGSARWTVSLAGSDPETPTAIGAGSVLLADGGFQANPAMLKRYVGTDQVKVRATSSGTGDGLRMGLANGGVAVNMKGFYGHLLAREARERADLWPYPILDVLALVGIVVAPDGTRLVDENIGGVTTTNEIAWSTHPADCWLLFDDDAWHTNATIGITAPNPWLVDHGATVIAADTLVELAARSGIDATQLTATVDDLATGRAQPPRTGTVKLSNPPYRAVPLIAGVTFTMGGLRVDQSAQLLNSNGTAIGGLYAAGGTMGGLHGGPRVGYAGGLLEAAVFGLLAGEHVGDSQGPATAAPS